MGRSQSYDVFGVNACRLLFSSVISRNAILQATDTHKSARIRRLDGPVFVLSQIGVGFFS